MTVSYRVALLALVLSPIAAFAEVKTIENHPGHAVASVAPGRVPRVAKLRRWQTGTQLAAHGCRERWREGNGSERQTQTLCRRSVEDALPEGDSPARTHQRGLWLEITSKSLDNPLAIANNRVHWNSLLAMIKRMSRDGDVPA